MIEGLLLGFYAGIGLCVGIWFYLTVNDMMMGDDPRWIRAIQAVITAVGWLPIFVVVIVPEIARDLYRWYGPSRGESDVE